VYSGGGLALRQQQHDAAPLCLNPALGLTHHVPNLKLLRHVQLNTYLHDKKPLGFVTFALNTKTINPWGFFCYI
jgi:hypothetical protein